MSIQIVKEGSIEGWFVALCETILIFGLLTAGFFVPSVRVAWMTMGSYVQVIYPLALGSWFAYKAVQSLTPNKEVV